MIRMRPFTRSSALILGFAAAGFAAAACGIPASQAGSPAVAPATNGPVRCEIRIDEARGATIIEGHVSADRPVRGSYRLAITSRSSGGQATINQSGEFTAGPREPSLLGQTMLGGSRASHRAELDLQIDGQRLRCTEAGPAAPGPHDI
ncbi:MAG: curli-like amyloid fiber formation chaperone CsgH [Pararhodobacter sp.]